VYIFLFYFLQWIRHRKTRSHTWWRLGTSSYTC